MESLIAAKSNAIYVCHALTEISSCSWIYEGEEKTVGWWNHVVGPGKPLDTNRFFVISSNCLGGCRGSTGPSSQKLMDLGKHMEHPFQIYP